jgi:DNA-binding NarL/FixJ family response regulator
MGDSALFARMASVVDPLAVRYGGQPTEAVKPILRRTWRQAFDAELPESTLTRCAQAIHDCRPWADELLNGRGHDRAFTPQRQVVIIDSHELLSTALALALHCSGLDARQLTITHGAEAILAQVRHLPGALALLDLHLGKDVHGHRIDGVDLIEPLRLHDGVVLVFSGGQDTARQAAALAAGAIGLVPKSSSYQELLRIVLAAAAGEPVMTHAERRQWMIQHHDYQIQEHAVARQLERLTPREREVLDLLAQGYRAADITQTFVVSLATVRTQIRAILTKLGVNSQLEATALIHQPHGPSLARQRPPTTVPAPSTGHQGPRGGRVSVPELSPSRFANLRSDLTRSAPQ